MAADSFESFKNQSAAGTAVTAANSPAKSAAAGAFIPGISRVPNSSGSCRNAMTDMQQKQSIPLYLAFSSAMRVSEYMIPAAAPSSGKASS